MNEDLHVVLCTVPDHDTAENIARTLVTERLAACVNIVPGVTSVYRWEDAIEREQELLLLIKTSQTAWPLLEQRIRGLHPYELPEIIAVPLINGQADYITWLNNSLITK